MTPATARSRSRTHARRSPAPHGPRRISGPLAAAAGAASLPRRGTTSVFERIRALPDHRVVETTATLERQNADIEASIARLSAPDRIESGASTLGMVMPPAGDVSYLTAGPQDPSNAVRRMQPPSDDAAALLANHGIVPGSLAASAPAAGTT